ncbi:MAG: SsrA-binding protein SmpB [Alphaproteobacteria bacterium]|jgi:SsrA-binding protein|nr:SsrA-binding protein SmpB [Alphaproteobacteria bacterium]
MLRKNGDTIAENRRGTFDYFIEETLEVGLMLVGSEVKSLREGKASIVEAHAAEKAGIFYLFNANIAEYLGANRFNHEPKRPRQLLIRRREIKRLISAVQRKGYTLIPIALYFNGRGLVKLKLGIAKGKKMADKRQTMKERDWQRQKERTLKGAD